MPDNKLTVENIEDNRLKIRKIYIKSYKMFQDFNIDFTEKVGNILPVTVISGINSSGKTSLFLYKKLSIILYKRYGIRIEEQSLLCSYCEREIDADPNISNIDHFKKRDLFPNLTLDYNNLIEVNRSA